MNVPERDLWLCQLCGVPIDTLIEIERNAPYLTRQLGWQDRRGHLYEIDHIRPRALGGSNDPGNLRLLCIPDHKAETKKLAGVLAKSRRREKKAREHQQNLLSED